MWAGLREKRLPWASSGERGRTSVAGHRIMSESPFAGKSWKRVRTLPKSLNGRSVGVQLILSAPLETFNLTSGKQFLHKLKIIQSELCKYIRWDKGGGSAVVYCEVKKMLKPKGGRLYLKIWWSKTGEGCIFWRSLRRTMKLWWSEENKNPAVWSSCVLTYNLLIPLKSTGDLDPSTSSRLL